MVQSQVSHLHCLGNETEHHQIKNQNLNSIKPNKFNSKPKSFPFSRNDKVKSTLPKNKDNNSHNNPKKKTKLKKVTFLRVDEVDVAVAERMAVGGVPTDPYGRDGLELTESIVQLTIGDVRIKVSDVQRRSRHTHRQRINGHDRTKRTERTERRKTKRKNKKTQSLFQALREPINNNARCNRCSVFY